MIEKHSLMQIEMLPLDIWFSCNVLEDNKQGSLRLGELVKLKNTIAVGIKDRGNTINKLFEGILQGDKFKVELDGPNSAFTPGHYQDRERNSDILPQDISISGPEHTQNQAMMDNCFA
ncbi:hypothetical protein RIF29_03306 [Crotalaria pallida]|uniref:Uncharacterized protein n=1 Tax=Crotalaria pallida TaxID=3830 RepID=A0AAN9IZT5_CROPI